jgi:hypothetical protein
VGDSGDRQRASAPNAQPRQALASRW